jgi:hypothetical protein
MDTLENLKRPGALMRPAPFWSWNDKLDEAELRRQIRDMAEKGWGSYFMHSRVGLVTGYLSDEWMALVNACADEAAKTGTYAWLYDEDKWPSGYAGGIVPESDKAYRSRTLILLKKGTATEDETVLNTVNYGGAEYDICKRIAPLTSVWFNGASYVDLMNPEAVRKFIDSTHEKYKAACGQHFGKTIPGIFTDEPCYIFQDSPFPIVPWSEYLPDLFKELKGYDIQDKLPQLFFDIDDYHKVRFDFYDTATKLFKQSFTKQYFDWCRENNLLFTGHFMSEDSLWFQTQWSGDVMAHYEFMNWPGIDKLFRQTEQIVTVKQLTSAVDQLEKERAFCEVFGCVGGQVSFFHRKWIADWEAALGISFVNHHLSLYSMRGERKRDYPANLFYQQPWWEDEKDFADYLGRLCAAVSEGKRLVDILVFQPLTSAWSEYSPLHKDSGFAAEKAYDDPFAAISARLMEEKLDYHYGNENLMAEHASVEGNRLKVASRTYGCVVVPPSLNIKTSTFELLKKYAQAGGKLIFIGRIPSLIDGNPANTKIAGATVVPTIADAIEILKGMYTDGVKVVDTYTDANAPTVYVHSRAVEGSVRHLLVNIDEHREVRAKITIPESNGRVGIFDLADGSAYKIDSESGTFDVVLAPAGSLLAITGAEVTDDLQTPPSVLGSGACFDDLAGKHPVEVIKDFDCRVLEENVLLLNDFALDMAGKKVYEGPACAAWHQHFYSAPDGTPFKATYTFRSTCDLDGCFAAIEVAENLDSIEFNGTPVHALKKPGELGAFDANKSWKDINFTRVALPTVQKGVNTLVIKGIKVNNITGPGFHTRVPNWQEHKPTEAEEVYICGRFALEELSESEYAIKAFETPAGKNLTAEGFPFYAGKIALRAGFTAESGKKTFIRLNDAEMASARVKVNGEDCGILTWKPFIVDISSAVKPGENRIEIEMATTLVNCFGPNRFSNVKEERGIGPGTFIHMGKFQKEYEFFDFGLGSVSVYSE